MIIFYFYFPTDNKNRIYGFIKSTQASKTEEQYCGPDEMLSSVYLSNDDRTVHKIYGSSKDNSIGIGSFIKVK